MTYIVLCYGQPAQPQRLARAGQTSGDGTAALVLGEPRLTCRWDVDVRTGRVGRERAVIVYNPRGVTHFIPYHSTRVFPVYFVYKPSPPLSLSPALRITYHSHAHRALAGLHALTRHARFSLFILTFLLPSYHATLWLPTSVQLQPHY